MLRSKRSPVVFILCVCFSGYLYGQAWSGILSSSRAIDWSHAGAPHINDARTQCGSTIDAYSGSAATINNALAACGADHYVLLGPGTFTLSSAIVVQQPGTVTLRGSGSNSTFLVFTGASASYSYCSNFNLCAASSDPNNAAGTSNSANWTAGYEKGTTTIALSNANNLKVGAPLILDQIDNQSDNGGVYVGCEIGDGSAACYSQAGPSSFQRGSGRLSTIRGQQQVVTVASCDGNSTPGHACSSGANIAITPGLYAPNWNSGSGRSPGAWWASNPVHDVGFENFSLTPSSGSAGGMFLFNCQGCWAKGLRGTLTSSPGGFGWGDVVLSICNHCTVRDSYFYGAPNVDDYVIAVNIASDLLVENNVVQKPGTAQFYNSDCEGCVAAYNFSVNALYSGSANWLNQSSDYHAVTLFSLAEGNIGTGLYADSFHGTHDFNTNFRNRWDGREQNNGSLTSSNTAPVILNPGTRYHNLIGNVLGTAGYHNSYKAGSDTSIYCLGCDYFGATDSLTASTSMFWGNWDTATNAVRWCVDSTSPCTGSEVPSGLSAYGNAVPSGHTLPASFYLPSKPSWWPSGKAWPSIGPDVTGGTVGQCVGGTMASSSCTASSQCAGGACSVVAGGRVVSNPAMDCYLDTMGGSANGTGPALAFDAAACYSSSGGGGGVDPPSGLSAVVH